MYLAARLSHRKASFSKTPGQGSGSLIFVPDAGKVSGYWMLQNLAKYRIAWFLYQVEAKYPVAGLSNQRACF